MIDFVKPAVTVVCLLVLGIVAVAAVLWIVVKMIEAAASEVESFDRFCARLVLTVMALAPFAAGAAWGLGWFES